MKIERNLPALPRRLSEIIEEYETKVAAVEEALADFEAAGNKLKTACTIGGTWGNTTIDTGRVYDSNMKDSLLKSAWRYVYNGLSIESVAPASDKQKFERAMADPPDFTIDNIRATFGDYIKDPMGNILRGLAEVFCNLDPAYKSHDKVKVGVQGLPKRVIISGLNSYSGYGRDRIRDVLNALAAYQGKPLVEYRELAALEADGDCLRHPGVLPQTSRYQEEEAKTVGRGVWLRRYKNGNGHLYFDEPTLKDINLALAEYYGDVLPDCHEEKPTAKRAGTDVSKDLQYYPTPKDVVERIVGDVYLRDGLTVLEPSCGCGRFMDAIKKAGGEAFGIEAHPGRAQQCRDKGHRVLTANFLDVKPEAKYDLVIMNPPFYGKHYAKHVQHALKFLKRGGKLISILPSTARYDHGLLDGQWYDLPTGSFKESGTNISTSVLTMYAEK